MSPAPTRIRWNEVIAFFGGTFDPPHIGHREAIAGLSNAPGVSQVVVLPSALPPQKSTNATAEQRLEMLRLTMIGIRSEVSIDPREIDRARLSRTPSFTFDTLVELKRELSPRPLAFVIGADQLSTPPPSGAPSSAAQGLMSWHRFPEILGLCHWIVLGRMPLGLDPVRRTLSLLQASGLARPAPEQDGECWRLLPSQAPAPQGPTYLRLCTTEAQAYSSTHIRETLARAGTAPPGSLAPSVVQFMMHHRLYGSSVVVPRDHEDI